jgi:radical SAM protein with 4Fe4S-binding SPASM domain
VRALYAIPVRSVTLSIDSPIARIHDEVRGQDGAYARTVKGLDRLLAKRKAKTKIRLNTVVSTATYRSLIEMVPFLRARGVSIDGWKLLPIDPWTTASMALGLAEIRDYTRTIAPALAELAIPDFDPFVYGRDETAWAQAARGEHARGAYEDRPCYAPWLHLLVDSRGDTYPCCAGHGRLPRLGNTREARLGEIFAGDAATAFRRDMLRARPALCATCDDFLVENAAIHEVVS